MKFLLLGDTKQLRRLYDCLCEATSNIVLWKDTRTALETLRHSQDKFCWAFFDCDLCAGETLQVASQLRRRDPNIGISVLNHHTGSASDARKPLLCALENAPDGTTRLRCALQRARQVADADPMLTTLLAETPSGVGYIAPMKTEKRS